MSDSNPKKISTRSQSVDRRENIDFSLRNFFEISKNVPNYKELRELFARQLGIDSKELETLRSLHLKSNSTESISSPSFSKADKLLSAQVQVERLPLQQPKDPFSPGRTLARSPVRRELIPARTNQTEIDFEAIPSTENIQTISEEPGSTNSPSEPLERFEMAEAKLTYRDAVMYLKEFSGNDLERASFIAQCDLYMRKVDPAIRDDLLELIKTKIVREAHAKIAPMDSHATWEDLKRKILSLKKPVSMRAAKIKLKAVYQNTAESISDYGARVSKLLEEINDAAEASEETPAALRKMLQQNESLAIDMFVENILWEPLCLAVSGAKHATLGEAIDYAIQKEYAKKHSNVPVCTYYQCKRRGHTEENCKKKATDAKKKQQDQGKTPKKSYGNSTPRGQYRNDCDPGNSSADSPKKPFHKNNNGNVNSNKDQQKRANVISEAGNESAKVTLAELQKN